MAREDQGSARRRHDPARHDRSDDGNEHRGEPQGEDQPGWFGGDRGNEFGGEGRFRTEGGHGSHFGGAPDSLGDERTQRPAGQSKNYRAWLGERRRKFMERFDRWRRERAARAASSGPDAEATRSEPSASGRKAEK